MNSGAASDPTLIGGTGISYVLVVDDEPAVRDVSKLFLEQNGYKVFTAEDGLQALQLFGEHSREIALVLLDLSMPGMNGEEVYRALRGIRPDLPIILSSGYGEHETMGMIKDSALTSFIRKPYRPKALLDKVREILEH
jgi:two-component system, cell cycle sensor histidine kinase and response regulator CckA